MTWLVFPLEVFDVENTERWKKITPGETLHRGFALKVHLSVFVCLCTCSVHAGADNAQSHRLHFYTGVV